MNVLQKLRIRTQLFLGFGLLIGLIVVLAFFSVTKLGATSAAFHRQNDVQFIKLEPLYEAREALAQTGLAARNAFIFTDRSQADRELAILDEEKAIYLAALEKMAPNFAKNPEFDKVRSDMLSMAEALKRPRALREAGKMEEFGLFLVNECSPLRRQIVGEIDKLVRKVQAENTQATVAAETSSRDARFWIIVAAAMSVVVGVTLAALILRTLLRQLGGEPAYASDIANRIAAGDLSVEVAVSRKDNYSLLFAIKTMRDSLQGIVGRVREGTDAISTASSEIAAGNLDLSSRTEQQAGSLETIATAMEELTSTVKQNADNAQQANSLSLSASSVSERSGKVMAQVTETMASIDNSSKKIVEIISVIDGIAFQTNILALNAAVEAARAGEQGRGFAVVASEVRTLAYRSAQAAKEIKVLIDDSVRQVSAGSELVQLAGVTVDEVVSSVKRVTTIMGDISVASKEQQAGIEAVNHSIGAMDGVTQQNTALVEEASAAAQELQHQALLLAEVVNVFKLSDSASQRASEVETYSKATKRGFEDDVRQLAFG